MSFMLPAAPSHARSITGVAQELFASLEGRSDWGKPRSVVLCVIDGLGAIQLRSHAGHARRLSAWMARKDVAHSVFPSTTAAALTSILTGAHPGAHGLVGYSVRDPAQNRVINQLTGWEKEGLDPASWQRNETIFERALQMERRAFAVGPAEYAGSGFSNAVLRGAEYVSCSALADRFASAVALANEHSGSVVYCYMPEVDKAGHKFGVDSDQWLAALEDVDAAFAVAVPADVGVVMTADHGMIDVPATRHVVLDADDPRWDGVAMLGGEPRMMHVYLEPDASVPLAAARWAELGGKSADIVTRDEALAANLFGPVAEDVVQRIGELLVITRGIWAYYDGTLADTRSQKMIGQHGSVSPEETMVPLIRAGAFARQ